MTLENKEDSVKQGCKLTVHVILIKNLKTHHGKQHDVWMNITGMLACSGIIYFAPFPGTVTLASRHHVTCKTYQIAVASLHMLTSMASVLEMSYALEPNWCGNTTRGMWHLFCLVQYIWSQSISNKADIAATSWFHKVPSPDRGNQLATTAFTQINWPPPLHSPCLGVIYFEGYLRN